MSPGVRRLLWGCGVPLFYGFCLLLFLRLTLPFDELRSLAESRLNAALVDHPDVQVEIGALGGHWLSGVEARDVVFVVKEPVDSSAPAAASPAQAAPDKPAPAGGAEAAVPAAATGERRFVLDTLTVSVSPLSVFGTLRASVDAEGFGGAFDGSLVQTKTDDRTVHIELDSVELGDVPLLASTLGAPVRGRVSGTIDLEIPGGKLAEAEGLIDLRCEGLIVGDGKTKLRGALALPPIDAGNLVLKAEVTKGTLRIEKAETDGSDLVASVAGTIQLRDPYERSIVGLELRFRFTDEYRGRNELTKGMLGEPGSASGGVIDLDPNSRRAKQEDGGYVWSLAGPFSHPRFSPGPTVGARGSKPPRAAPKARDAAPAPEAEE